MRLIGLFRPIFFIFFFPFSIIFLRGHKGKKKKKKEKKKKKKFARRTIWHDLAVSKTNRAKDPSEMVLRTGTRFWGAVQKSIQAFFYSMFYKTNRSKKKGYFQ